MENNITYNGDIIFSLKMCKLNKRSISGILEIYNKTWYDLVKQTVYVRCSNFYQFLVVCICYLLIDTNIEQVKKVYIELMLNKREDNIPELKKCITYAINNYEYVDNTHTFSDEDITYNTPILIKGSGKDYRKIKKILTNQTLNIAAFMNQKIT